MVMDPMVAAHEAWNYLVPCQAVVLVAEVHGMTVCRLLQIKLVSERTYIYILS